MTLDQAPTGQYVKIEHIQDETIAIMAVRLGIAAGETVMVVSKVPSGPLVIRRGKVDIALGRDLCKEINITPAA